MKVGIYYSILLCIFFVNRVQGSEILNDGYLRIGVSVSGFNEINRNDAAAALKAWAATVAEEQDLEERIEVILLPSSVENLRVALKERQLDGISLSVEEFMQLDLQVDDVYIPIPEQGPANRYAVIVHSEGGIIHPKDLIGRKLVIGDSGKMNLALPWLETLLAIHAGERSRHEFNQTDTAENPSKAILQVFFHQFDAAVVVTEAFDLACELNPQLRNKLKKLEESPPFIISFFIFPSEFNESRSTENLEKAILNLHTTPGGRQVLTVFKSSRVAKYPVSILDNTVQFLTGYQQLVNGAFMGKVQP